LDYGRERALERRGLACEEWEWRCGGVEGVEAVERVVYARWEEHEEHETATAYKIRSTVYG